MFGLSSDADAGALCLHHELLIYHGAGRPTMCFDTAGENEGMAAEILLSNKTTNDSLLFQIVQTQSAAAKYMMRNRMCSPGYAPNTIRSFSR